MKSLIVYAHPNPASYNNAVKETIESVLKTKGHEIKVSDLYAKNFNPVLSGSDLASFHSGQTPSDIADEQALIKWADTIYFVYPIWWIGMPAMMKGYIDRVFSYGFAYSSDANGIVKLLSDKKAVIVNTHGADGEAANQMHTAINAASDFGIFGFCGVEVLNHSYFGSVPYTDDATRKGYLEQIKEVVTKLA